MWNLKMLLQCLQYFLWHPNPLFPNHYWNAPLSVFFAKELMRISLRNLAQSVTPGSYIVLAKHRSALQTLLRDWPCLRSDATWGWMNAIQLTCWVLQPGLCLRHRKFFSEAGITFISVMFALRKTTVRWYSSTLSLIYYTPPRNDWWVRRVLLVYQRQHFSASLSEKKPGCCEYFYVGDGTWHNISKCLPHSSLFLSHSLSSFYPL